MLCKASLGPCAAFHLTGLRRPSCRALRSMATQASAAPAPSNRWAIAIHGGAGVINATNQEWLEDAYQGLQAALRAGQQVLEGGGSALDAVEAAVRHLEDEPHFNAGKGSVLTRDGHHELEASIMSSNGRCGAATLLRHTRYPISLARGVMEHSPHVLLSGAPAEELGRYLGIPYIEDNAWFTTEQRREQWQRYKKSNTLAAQDEIVQKIHASRSDAQMSDSGCSAASSTGLNNVHMTSSSSEGEEEALQQQQQQQLRDEEIAQHTQTVGAVAIDAAGNLAAATSTGGRTNKWDGRIGDTPIVGAGTWADKRCAVSGTGIGEEFLRRAAAHDVAARVAYKGIPLSAAVKEVVFGSFSPGDGGFIGVDDEYNIVMEFNTMGMYRAAADSSGRFEAAIFKE